MYNRCNFAPWNRLISTFILSISFLLFKRIVCKIAFFDHSIDFRLDKAFFLMTMSLQRFRIIIESWLIQGQFQVVQFLLGCLYCDIDNRIASRFFSNLNRHTSLDFQKNLIFPVILSWYFFRRFILSVAKLPLVFASR